MYIHRSFCVCLFKVVQLLNAHVLQRVRERNVAPAPHHARRPGSPTPRRFARTDCAQGSSPRCPRLPGPRNSVLPQPLPRPPHSGELGVNGRAGTSAPHTAHGSPFGTFSHLSRPGARAGTAGRTRLPRSPRAAAVLGSPASRTAASVATLTPGTSARCPGAAQPLSCPTGPRSRDPGCRPQPLPGALSCLPRNTPQTSPQPAGEGAGLPTWGLK